MADLPESNEWPAGIYQLETSDPVLGGPEGIDNLQAKQLANRTLWLKVKADSLGTSKANKATTLGGYGITDAYTKPETATAIQQAIASLVASSPSALDTLRELADALGNDPNFATTMTNALAAKAAKATTLGGYGITDAFTKPEAAAAIQQAIASLVNSSPAALDTLKELAEALGNDPNFATTMTNALANKANKATSLVGYGITDTYTKDQIEAMIAQASALPVGSMIGFPVDKVAPGFLELDGSVKSVATYPDLATFLGGAFNKGDEGAGNFRLPESRAEFLRGWDHGRGVDAGRAIGSWQKGTLQSFDIGPSNGVCGPRSGVLPATGDNSRADLGYDATQSALYPSAAVAVGNAGTVSGLADNGEISYGATRPRNLAVMWCVKAWNAPINQGSIDVAALAASVAALNPENRRKTSPWVSMSLGGAYTFGHGFGAEPWVTSLEVKCITATPGFIVGKTMVIATAGSADGGSSSTSSPIAVWHDELNCYARFGAATAVNLTRPDDGVQVVVPFANFQVRLKVEK